MRFSCLVVCLIVCCSVHAQFIIKYNLDGFKTSYFRVEEQDTVSVRKMKAKNNQRVNLVVENYNPFYWNVRVSAIKAEADSDGSNSGFNPFSVLAKGLGGVFGTMPLLDLPEARGESEDAENKFIRTAGLFQDHYLRVKELNEKREKLYLTKVFLNELKYNPKKTESVIKREARAAVTDVLDQDSLDLFSSYYLAKRFSTGFANSVDSAKKLNTQLQQQLKSVNPDEEIDGKTFADIAHSVKNSVAIIENVESLLKNKENVLENEVLEIVSLYREIISAEYRFDYSITIYPELSSLKMELFPKVEVPVKDTLVQFFTLKDSRGLRIRNSVGLTFTYFEGHRYRYLIGADSIIRRTERDLFTPLLSTFIHFYPARSHGVKLGGTLGFGVPLTGDKKDINFLLGLAAALGPNEPVMISLGIGGAKVNKLTNGFAVGQKTAERNEDKIVTSGYGIGGFLAVSFNLNSVRKK